jgi:hypothetical protein
MMLHATVGSIVGLYEATRSVPVTLVGFGLAGCVTGWYLWVRHGSDDDVSPKIPSGDKANERRFRASEEQRLILSQWFTLPTDREPARPGHPVERPVSSAG